MTTLWQPPARNCTFDIRPEPLKGSNRRSKDRWSTTRLSNGRVDRAMDTPSQCIGEPSELYVRGIVAGLLRPRGFAIDALEFLFTVRERRSFSSVISVRAELIVITLRERLPPV